MDSVNMCSSIHYHITGGFIRYPIDVSCSVSTSPSTTDSVTEFYPIQYLKKIMLRPDYTRRTVYFRPDYENCTQLDESTWRIPMIARPPSEYPDYVTSVLPKFESYPESYKQRIRVSNIMTWEENAFESIEYNACDILIRRI